MFRWRGSLDDCCDDRCSGGKDHTMIAVMNGVQVGRIGQPVSAQWRGSLPKQTRGRRPPA